MAIQVTIFRVLFIDFYLYNQSICLLNHTIFLATETSQYTSAFTLLLLLGLLID